MKRQGSNSLNLTNGLLRGQMEHVMPSQSQTPPRIPVRRILEYSISTKVFTIEDAGRTADLFGSMDIGTQIRERMIMTESQGGFISHFTGSWWPSSMGISRFFL
jgi:hypothetical protein